MTLKGWPWHRSPGSRPVNLSTVTELTVDSDGRQSDVSQWNVKHMWNNCRIQVFKQRLSMLHQTCFLFVAHSNLSVDRHAISWFDGCSHVLLLDAVRHAVAIAQHWWTPQLEGEESVVAALLGSFDLSGGWFLSWHQKGWGLGFLSKVWGLAQHAASSGLQMCLQLARCSIALNSPTPKLLNVNSPFSGHGLSLKPRCGRIGDVYLPRDHDTQKNRGFAFVRFFEAWRSCWSCWSCYGNFDHPFGYRVWLLGYRLTMGYPYFLCHFEPRTRRMQRCAFRCLGVWYPIALNATVPLWLDLCQSTFMSWGHGWSDVSRIQIAREFCAGRGFSNTSVGARAEIGSPTIFRMSVPRLSCWFSVEMLSTYPDPRPWPHESNPLNSRSMLKGSDRLVSL